MPSPAIFSGRYHAAASPNTATAASGQFLVDPAGNRWGITSGLVTFNGVSVASPTSVLNIALVNGAIWAETSPTTWTLIGVTNGVAAASGGAQANPLPTLTSITLSNASFTPAGSAAGTVVGTISVTATSGAFAPALGTLTLSGTDAAKFQIVGGVLQLSGAQVSGTYAINIIATQNLCPGSPLTQALSITGISAESAAGTTVSTVGPSINASPTPGTPGSGNVLTLTSGGQIALNGTVLGGTAVDILYYIGNTAFQRGSLYWWGPVTASGTGGAANNPYPAVSLGNASVAAGAPNGTVVGALTTTTGAGSYTWAYALSGTNAGSFTVNSAGNLITVGALANGSYGPFTITATPTPAISGGPFTTTATVAVSVAESQAGTSITTVGPALNASTTPGTAGTGNSIVLTSGGQIAVNGGTPFGAAVTALYYIGSTAFQLGSGAWYGPVTASGGGTSVNAPQPTLTLSNNTVAAAAIAGSTVGTLAVAVGAGTYAWTYALSGTNASSFQLSGSTLQTSSSLAAGSYAVTITATNASVIGSPFTLSVNVSASIGGTGGVSFPAVGIYNDTEDYGVLAISNQPLGAWAAQTMYNEYWNGWANWGNLDGRQSGYPFPPWLTIQCSPGPNNVTFNASDFANNHLDAMNQLATSCAALGSNLLSIQIYEWNQGGAFDFGWDEPGNQTLFITFYRNLAAAFKNIAPNVIRGWCMNHNVMRSGGVPEDWYPGDDVVDAIGMEFYMAYSGSPAGGGYGNFAWMAGMGAQTRLGPNHPAKATGSMMINGVNTPIPTGKQKYIILAEGQADTAVDPNGITELFQWVSQQQGRVLPIVYWNDSLVGTNNNQDIMHPNTTSGQQWAAGVNGKQYPHPWPIPRFT